MKKTLIQGVICVGAVMGLAACSDSNEPGISNGAGRIALTMNVDNSVSSSRESRAEASDVTADNLALKLTSSDGSFSKTWSSIADFDKEESFSVGTYTLEAYYGDETSEGFEAPYFHGSAQVKVQENQTTPVALTAALANAMVSITYTEQFREYMADWSAEVHSAGGTYTFYAKDEARPVYVRPGDVTINLDITKPNGTHGQLRAATFTAAARTHYHMTFDVNQGSGEAVLSIIFDESLNEETIEIELSDELMNAPAPELTAEGFTSGEAIKFVPGMAPSTPLKLNIIARGYIAAVNMTTVSPSLIAQGWPAEIDLIAAPENMRQRLTGLGLSCRGIYTNPEKLAVIDLTEVLSHISESSEITFEVVDRYGKVSDRVTLTTEVEPLALSIPAVGTLYMGASAMDIELAYNGPEPEKNVTVQYKNDRGTWTAAAMTAEKTADGIYKATISGLPASTEPLVIRAISGSLTTPEVTVERSPVAVDAAVDDRDVFATTATATLSINNAPEGVDLAAIIAGSSAMLSTDGTNFTAATATASGSSLHLSGLTPATTYTLKIKSGTAEGQSVKFTTEAARQLENGSLEDWTSTAHASNMVEWFVGGDIWGTLNPLTISQWEQGKWLGNVLNYAYRASSGTLETDGANGKGALIRTIAWGHATTAAGSASDIKNVSRGELYLGSWNSSASQPSYGTAFASRPAGLKFNYKFSAYNNHNGYVEIVVKDASGNTIASAEKEITDQGSTFNEMTLPLTYAASSAKAASMTLLFTSSKETSLGKNDVNLVFDASVFGGSSSVHVGSQLYIDDIQLIY